MRYKHVQFFGIDVDQLRYFRTVARHGHITRAAQELRIAQPALSRSIGRLEAELGVPLFDRHGRRIALNRFGRAFLAGTDRALGALDEAQAQLSDMAGLQRGTVSLAAEMLRPTSRLIGGFLAECPEVSLRLQELSAPEMVAALGAGEVDLCIASQPLVAPGLQSSTLSREDVLLAVPPTHALAGRARIALAEVGALPLVTSPPGFWPRELADRLFAGAGITATIACESAAVDGIRALVSAGVGVGLLPAIARQFDRPPVAWLRITDAQSTRTLRLVSNRSRYLSAAARRFRDFTVSERALLSDP